MRSAPAQRRSLTSGDSARLVVDAERDAVVVAEVELRKVTVEMGLAAAVDGLQPHPGTTLAARRTKPVSASPDRQRRRLSSAGSCQSLPPDIGETPRLLAGRIRCRGQANASHRFSQVALASYHQALVCPHDDAHARRTAGSLELSLTGLTLKTRLRRCQKQDSQNASRPRRHQIGMVGEIIPESWAR